MAPSPQQRRQFKIGKYDILAQPALGSMHMLRYTVMLNGKRLGAFLSMRPSRTASSSKARRWCRP